MKVVHAGFLIVALHPIFSALWKLLPGGNRVRGLEAFGCGLDLTLDLRQACSCLAEAHSELCLGLAIGELSLRIETVAVVNLQLGDLLLGSI